MPIRAEMRGKYPREWDLISLSVRVHAGWACQQCGAKQGQPHPITGSKVVLTVAHLGLPAKLPLLFHVAGDAVTDEVVELICFLMTSDAECPKWNAMMHDRATAEFLRGPSACGTRFFVALPGSTSGLLPTRPIVFGAQAAAPVWVRLTDWRLLAEPSQSALIAAEAAAGVEIEAADLKCASAPLAGSGAESPFRAAYCFRTAGIRTSPAAVRSLLRCDWEPLAANGAVDCGLGFARSGHAHLYHIDDYPENCAADNLRAWCQRCHNRYDAPMRASGIKRRAEARIGQASLAVV